MTTPIIPTNVIEQMSVEQVKAKLDQHEKKLALRRKKWREHRQDYYEKNTAAMLEYQRVWYLNNREGILARRRERYNTRQLEKLLSRTSPQQYSSD